MTSLMRFVMFRGEGFWLKRAASSAIVCGPVVDSVKVRTGSSAAYLSSALESQSSLLLLMFCVTPMAVCALLAVFDVSVPFIKLDHNFNVSAETSCRMPDCYRNTDRRFSKLCMTATV